MLVLQMWEVAERTDRVCWTALPPGKQIARVKWEMLSADTKQ